MKRKSESESEEDLYIVKELETRIAQLKERHANITPSTSFFDLAEEKDKLQSLQNSAMKYRSRIYYGPEDERKTCIWPGGGLVTWTEESSGISWIGVNGIDATCAVATIDVTCRRPAGKTQLGARAVLFTAVADMLGVSVAPGVPEKSQECEQASHAINFLMEKLKDRSSLSSKETEQLAICALKYLLGRKFKTRKIMAFVITKGKWGMDQMPKRRVLLAINETTTTDLTTSVSSISLSSP